MTRNPVACLLTFLSLAISLAIFTPPTFGQFEEAPGQEAKTVDEVQDPVLDAFGASPDEFEAEETKDNTDRDIRSDTKPADVTSDKSTPTGSGDTKDSSRDKAAATDNSQKKAANQDSTGKSTDDKPFEEQFWQYLKANNYSNWAPAPGSSGDYYPGESPHGDLLKIYMNRTAAGNPADLPTGSVIVKESYDSDKELLGITVMYRAAGYYPKSGNWYWVKYNPDGTVARTSTDAGSKKIRGVVASCIACHSDAGGGDFVFFNDRR